MRLFARAVVTFDSGRSGSLGAATAAATVVMAFILVFVILVLTLQLWASFLGQACDFLELP